MKHKNKLFNLSVAVLLGASALSGSSHAELLPKYTGWSALQDCPPCDSMVSFAVYKNTDGDWTDDALFSGIPKVSLSGAIDSKAKYVYLYQIINTDYNQDLVPPIPLPPESNLADFHILIPSKLNIYTSGGYFEALFKDKKGVVRGPFNSNVTLAEPDFANDYYDTDSDTTYPEDDRAPDDGPSPSRNVLPPADHIPNRNFVKGVGLEAASAVEFVAPTSLNLFDDTDFNPGFSAGPELMIEKVVDFNWDDMTAFQTDVTSPVIFVTSDFAPAYDFASTRSWDVDNILVGTDFSPDGTFPGAAADLPGATHRHDD